MTKIVRFAHESASAKLTIWDTERATLGNVIALKRRRGHATGLMEKVARYADKRGLTVLLEARQYGYHDSMRNPQLREFYKKFGFVHCGQDLMQRKPREIHGP